MIMGRYIIPSLSMGLQEFRLRGLGGEGEAPPKKFSGMWDCLSCGFKDNYGTRDACKGCGANVILALGIIPGNKFVALLGWH